MFTRLVMLAAVGAALVSTAATAEAAPQVVATVAPVHSLTAMVMQDVGEPTLLVRPGASPHAHALRPSEAQALDDAEIVIWIGDQLETFMSRPIAALASDATILTLAAVPGVHLLDARIDGNWPGHAHEPGGTAQNHEHLVGQGGTDRHTHDHRHGGGGIDPHLWLDTTNAKVWLNAIATALANADAENAPVYRSNAASAVRKIDATEAKIREIVAPVRDVPYVVFHDAYRYFEERFGTNAVGAVSLSDAQKPGAAHVQALREKMRTQGVACIFSEPQFEPRLVSILTEGTNIRHGVLDPLGADLPTGSQQYFTLLTNLAQSLRACLSS